MVWCFGACLTQKQCECAAARHHSYSSHKKKPRHTRRTNLDDKGDEEDDGDGLKDDVGARREGGVLEVLLCVLRVLSRRKREAARSQREKSNASRPHQTCRMTKSVIAISTQHDAGWSSAHSRRRRAACHALRTTTAAAAPPAPPPPPPSLTPLMLPASAAESAVLRRRCRGRLLVDERARNSR